MSCDWTLAFSWTIFCWGSGVNVDSFFFKATMICLSFGLTWNPSWALHQVLLWSNFLLLLLLLLLLLTLTGTPRWSRQRWDLMFWLLLVLALAFLLATIRSLLGGLRSMARRLRGATTRVPILLCPGSSILSLGIAPWILVTLAVRALGRLVVLVQSLGPVSATLTTKKGGGLVQPFAKATLPWCLPVAVALRGSCEETLKMMVPRMVCCQSPAESMQFQGGQNSDSHPVKVPAQSSRCPQSPQTTSPRRENCVHPQRWQKRCDIDQKVQEDTDNHIVPPKPGSAESYQCETVQ